MNLNSEQEIAGKALESFLSEKGGNQFFLLSGFAGTGKTFLLSKVLSGKKVVFTAPTNKAVKVLDSSLRAAMGGGSPTSVPPRTCTIHSLLGLALRADGGVKVIKQKDTDLTIDSFDAVVVDEASMVGAELLTYIKKAVEGTKTKVIFSGDPMQLPPVKELESGVWKLNIPKAELQTVMRYKDAILEYSTKVRGMVKSISPRITPISNNDGETGIFVHPSHLLSVLEKSNDDFQSQDKVKVIAWRNLAVDHYNQKIRRMLFEDSSGKFFLPTDRVVVTEPAMTIGGEEEGKPLASTDDEGTVISVDPGLIHGIDCFVLLIRLDTGKVVELTTPTPQGRIAYQAMKTRLADEAKFDPSRWADFWEYHESFHYIRHSYAITAHRSQGSTYEKVYVDLHDIMRNRNISESIRCLYVASTRASKQLHFPSRLTVF